MEWTVKRRYDGDTRSAWFAAYFSYDSKAQRRRLRQYRVSPVHGCYLVIAEDGRGRMARGDYATTPSAGRALAETWHLEWLRKRKKAR